MTSILTDEEREQIAAFSGIAVDRLAAFEAILAFKLESTSRSDGLNATGTRTLRVSYGGDMVQAAYDQIAQQAKEADEALAALDDEPRVIAGNTRWLLENRDHLHVASAALRACGAKAADR